MSRICVFALVGWCAIGAGSRCVALAEQQLVLVVIGAAGEEKYEEMFSVWAERWKDAASQGNSRHLQVGGQAEAPEGVSDKARLKELLLEASEEEAAALWLVLIGHGTFDGQEAKFNLAGPDFSAAELSQWLATCKRPLAVINCASASAPFIVRLSGANRVIVTSTKSGFEHNFARFGEFLSTSIADRTADLDKDEETSLLEAFLLAASQTSEFYESEARLATEHPLIDDNGDGRGTPADWFRGIRVVRQAKQDAAADGLFANQLRLIPNPNRRQLSPQAQAKRDELEKRLAAFRAKKGQMIEDDYYRAIEPLLVEMARLYAEQDRNASP